MYILQCILVIIATMFTTKKKRWFPNSQVCRSCGSSCFGWRTSQRGTQRWEASCCRCAGREKCWIFEARIYVISKVIQYAKASFRDDLFIVGLWVWFWSSLFSLCDIPLYWKTVGLVREVTQIFKVVSSHVLWRWWRYKCSCTLEFVTRLTRYGWCLTQDPGVWRFIMYPHLSSLCYHSGKVTVLGIGDHPKIFQTSLLIIRQERTERERQIFHHSEARTGGHMSRVKLIVWVGLFQRKGLLNRLIHVDSTFDMNIGCLLPATWGYTRTGMSIDASVHVFAFIYTVDIYIYILYEYIDLHVFFTYSHIFTYSRHNFSHINAYICFLYIYSYILQINIYTHT